LRAPLRGIQGFSEILIQDHGAALGPEGVDHLTMMQRAAVRMRHLLDDLMRLSRTNRAELHLAPVDLAKLARASLARLQAADPARRVAIDVDDAIVVVGDEALLGIALDNLLGNAWKFTSKRAHATIQVGTVRRGGAEVCFVRDDGAGFDLGRAGKLFSAFQRFHSSEEFDGTGLGLAIVQRVIQRHGGRIWAESAVDVGTAFYFTLSS
ncbi:MAG TPA: ATP-binding protein, partial [Kofleriaceae bacterium]|nr:ATP-binding protein [Kofleriaceae bacterium]